MPAKSDDTNLHGFGTEIADQPGADGHKVRGVADAEITEVIQRLDKLADRLGRWATRTTPEDVQTRKKLLDAQAVCVSAMRVIHRMATAAGAEPDAGPTLASFGMPPFAAEHATEQETIPELAPMSAVDTDAVLISYPDDDEEATHYQQHKPNRTNR